VFPFKYSHVDETVLSIPAGYKVFEMPKKVAVSNPDFDISVDCLQEDSRIIYRSRISFPNGRIRKEHFDTWNSAIRTLSDSYSHHLVLSRD
jgi:hypothetical protein